VIVGAEAVHPTENARLRCVGYVVGRVSVDASFVPLADLEDIRERCGANLPPDHACAAPEVRSVGRAVHDAGLPEF
jgi:hypothetical protein